ncbi:MAG: TIGR02147 family protein [Fibrobacteraceae bacterium]|nr:TIGR02147 family protein [Fibrobacteraceae bacterium]
MKPVMEYQNFRVYIREFYTEGHQRSGFTWRDFAKAAGYSSPVFLKLVCDGKANLSEVGVERTASAMGLVGVDLSYFRALVAFNQEKNTAQKKAHFKVMREIAKENASSLVGEDQYDYYESWVNPVVRELAPKIKGATASKIAEQVEFGTSTAEVKKALALLQKVGLLSKDDNGNFVQSSKAITTGSLDVASLSVREMHRQMGELAVRSLDEVDVAKRDISGLTIGISEDGFFKISKEIEDFRRRVSSIVMNDRGDERVYRMNIQLFPLTKNNLVCEGGENV